MLLVAKEWKPPGVDKVKTWIDDMRVWPNMMYGDIYNFLVESKAVDGQQMKNFKSLQSFNYFQSGNVGVTSSQTVSRTNEVFVHCNGDGSIVNGWCSCMAGQGHTCSHVGAVLWKIEHAVRNNLTGVACTDENAKWNRGTTRNVEPKPLSNISFKKPKAGEDIMDSDEDNNIPGSRDTPMYTLDREFKEAVNNSNLLPLYSIKGTTASKSFTCKPFTKDIIQEDHGDHTALDSCGKCYNFLNKYISLTPANVQELHMNTKGQSTSSVLWKDARKIRLTASSASKVPIKETTDCSAFIREHLYPKFTGNKFTRYGNEQEPIAKKYLQSEGHNVVDHGMYVSFTENWLSASPDGIINGDTILEVKCPFPIANKWNCLDELIANTKYDVEKNSEGIYVLKKKGSRAYFMQIQLTMFCTGLHKAKIFIWRSPDDNILIDIAFDQEYIQQLVSRLRTFYSNKMLNRIVDEIDNDRLVLSRIFRNFMK
ncbi:unnamed protein product [Mytilus coruscus]|uniref:SWIM-type domain-containing protein n=1 Tax=Mytilus coruscus TaxID=42192 RepID=A0A6J8EJI1_MYTCO|nr:unnamed protein product [Mytilus coruscus]